MNAARRLLVVTPTLGTSPWLGRTVASVAAHASGHAQHVLVAPPVALRELGRRFPHCLLVADTAARGVYAAINLGLRGGDVGPWDWFTWINDDDELTPGFATHLARALAFDGGQPTAPWHYGRVRLRNASERDLGGLAVARFPTDIASLVQSGINPLNQQGLLAPSAWVDRLGLLREQLRICADLEYWLRALTAGAAFRFSPEEVAVFRLRPGQISGAVDRHRNEFAHVARDLLPRPIDPIRRVFARVRFRLANLPTYAGRLRCSGWRGGYALLHQPAVVKS